MNHTQVNWGRPRDDVYGPYDFAIHNAPSQQQPITHTQSPTVTGTSVIGIKFKDGVVIAADNLAAYGSLRRFNDMQRIFSLGDNTVVGIGGDISDLQSIKLKLDELEINLGYDDAGPSITPKSVFSWLKHVMYGRRNKLDPYWNSILVGGLQNGEPFLGYVNLLGVSYSSPSLATGFGSYLAVPILRKLCNVDGDEKNVTKEQAVEAVKQSMKVLYYRDGCAMDKYSLAIVTKDGISIEETKVENQSWAFASQIKGFGTNP